MDETVILEKLTLFGLTRQEAVLYLCLFRGGEMSGYEAAKQTGISRSNAYSGLAGLVEKGAAFFIEGEINNKYVAVPISEFCNNKIRGLEKEKDYLVSNLKPSGRSSSGYITISGYKHIRDKIITMLEGAEQRIYLSAPVSFIKGFQEELNQVIRKQIKVVLISDEADILAGTVTYQGAKKETQLRLIIDSAYVLTGEISESADDTCLYTGQKDFVNVFKEAMRNEIKLIELTGGEK